MLKLDGTIHILSETLEIAQLNEKQYVYLYVSEEDNPDGKDEIFECMQRTEPDDKGIELFRYTKNAEMSRYKNIDELFRDPMNRVDQRFCKFAIIGGNTLHPGYFRLFAKEVFKSVNATAEDVAFAYQCLNGVKNMDVVNQYLNQPSSNSDALNEMKRIVDRLRQNVPIPQEHTKKTEVESGCVELV